MSTLKSLLTLRKFTAWLAEQPLRKRYTYTDNHNCPIAQYLYANTRYRYANVGPSTLSVGVHPSGDRLRVEQLHFPYALTDTVNEPPYTFGAAARRATRMLTREKKS